MSNRSPRNTRRALQAVRPTTAPVAAPDPDFEDFIDGDDEELAAPVAVLPRRKGKKAARPATTRVFTVPPVGDGASDNERDLPRTLIAVSCPVRGYAGLRVFINVSASRRDMARKNADLVDQALEMALAELETDRARELAFNPALDEDGEERDVEDVLDEEAPRRARQAQLAAEQYSQHILAALVTDSWANWPFRTPAPTPGHLPDFEALGLDLISWLANTAPKEAYKLSVPKDSKKS